MVGKEAEGEVYLLQRKYHKELPLPEEVDPKPVKASYKNGVLEVRFKKKGKGENIRIQ